MPITFNAVLHAAGLEPKDVLLLRHQDPRATRGRSLYKLWRDDRAAFEDYQSRQKHGARRRFERRYWASFVGAPHGETLFVGLYRVGPCQPTEADWIAPHSGVVVPAGHDNIFALTFGASRPAHDPHDARPHGWHCAFTRANTRLRFGLSLNTRPLAGGG